MTSTREPDTDNADVGKFFMEDFCVKSSKFF